MTRSLKSSNCSSDLYQLADIAIDVLLSKDVQSSLKTHVQEALQALIREDGKAANNVRITENLFTEFLGNRLNID